MSDRYTRTREEWLRTCDDCDDLIDEPGDLINCSCLADVCDACYEYYGHHRHDDNEDNADLRELINLPWGNPMSNLDPIIRQLCTIGGQTRLPRGLGLRYTPPTKEYGSPASILSLSRPQTPPSATELQTIINSLARVLNAPGAAFLVTGAGLTRRIWFVNSLVAPPCQPRTITVYQAVTWSKDDWISLAVSTDPDEALNMGKRAAARLRYPGRVRVVSYQIPRKED